MSFPITTRGSSGWKSKPSASSKRPDRHQPESRHRLERMHCRPIHEHVGRREANRNARAFCRRRRAGRSSPASLTTTPAGITTQSTAVHLPRPTRIARPRGNDPRASVTALAGRALFLLGGVGEEPREWCELVWVGKEEDAIAGS